MSDDEDQDGLEKGAVLRHKLSLSQDELSFLRDEGREMLAAYRSIRDKRKRELILELLRAIAEDQPAVDGH